MKNLKYILSAMQSINRKIMIALVLASAFTACEAYEPWLPETTKKSKAELYTTFVSFQPSVVTGVTSGDTSLTWRLSVGEGAEYCKPTSTTGYVGNSFSVKFTENDTETLRTATIYIEFSDGYKNSFKVKQLLKTENPDYDRPWAEQPAELENGTYIYKTYYTTLSNSRVVRNYSVCYDMNKMCSRWVAYPVHSLYTSGRSYKVGSTTAGRTNAWAYDDAVTKYKASSNYNTAYEITSTYNSSLDTYDTYTLPIIPQSSQADIRFTNGFGSGYARGHMLPSANRYNTWQTNAQTCYSTNIMVQNSQFNGGSWGTLENTTRSKICSDTLFVVVGTLFENNKTIERYGKVIGVPTHCYKLWLRTKSGTTGKHICEITSADELMCIGFLYENSSEGNSTTMSEAAVSVAEIERRSGFKFFRNLRPEIADKVKAQKNLKDWGL